MSLETSQPSPPTNSNHPRQRGFHLSHSFYFCHISDSWIHICKAIFYAQVFSRPWYEAEKTGVSQGWLQITWVHSITFQCSSSTTSTCLFPSSCRNTRKNKGLNQHGVFFSEIIGRIPIGGPTPTWLDTEPIQSCILGLHILLNHYFYQGCKTRFRTTEDGPTASASWAGGWQGVHPVALREGGDHHPEPQRQWAQGGGAREVGPQGCCCQWGSSCSRTSSGAGPCQHRYHYFRLVSL